MYSNWLKINFLPCVSCTVASGGTPTVRSHNAYWLEKWHKKKTLNLARSNLIVRLYGDFRNQDAYVYIVCLKTESCYQSDFKGIVHPKMKMYSPSGHPKCRWVCCFFIGNIFEKKKYYKHAAFQFTRVIDGLEWCGLLMDYCDIFISCFDSHSDGTHSLQMIHWWASDGMLHFSKSVLMKKQTHLHLGWTESEYVFSKL